MATKQGCTQMAAEQLVMVLKQDITHDKRSLVMVLEARMHMAAEEFSNSNEV